MAQNLKTGDKVMVIAGDNKGKTAKIVKVKDGKAYLEGIEIRERHMKKTYLNPKGGKKDIHVGIVLSNLKLVEAAKVEKKTNAKLKKGAK
ncbi:KOW motif-containing protein [Candidatus Saccharibacteria bacterium]|nr:KOW motif-containing protein [Candidatus Saccharibacteria bacterium]